MKKLIAILSILVLFSGCTKQKNSNLVTFSNISVSSGFDTYLSIRLATDSQETFTEYFDQGVAEFTNFNQLFDIYNTYPSVNNLKTINDQAGISPVVVDQAIIDLLLLSKEFYDLSDGEFDITLGAVLQVWHRYREKNDGSLPTAEELLSASQCTGWEYLEINDDENTVFINNSCVSLDVGGIAKGFAAEEIAHSYLQEDIAMGIVDAGGNNRTIHSKLDGTPWRVGVQNPDGNGSLVVVSKEGSASFVTSGDYQRFFIGSDGNRYHHIINPRTNFPADHFRSVTIITENSSIADAFSTILFTLSYEEGLALISNYNSKNPNNPLSAIWVMDKEKEVTTSFGLSIGDYFCAYTEDLSDSIEIVQ